MENPQPETQDTTRRGLSRRSIVTAGAWATPVIALSVATPAFAASTSTATVSFTKVPGPIDAGGTFGDVVIAATTDGTTPAPAGDIITVQLLGSGLTFADGSTTKTFPATGAPASVTVSGIKSPTGTPAGDYSITASYSTATSVAILVVKAQAGNMYVWGWNASGEIGNKSTAIQTTPYRWTGSQKYTAVSGSYGQIAGLTTGGTIMTTGINAYGVLGIGSTSPGTTGAILGPLGPAISSAGGTFVASRFAQANSCLDSTIWARDRNDVLYAVGNNPGGKFSIAGVGSTKGNQLTNTSYTPVGLEILKANPGKKIVSVSDAGWWRALYLLDDGTVWNSGSNRFTAMGNNGTLDTMYLASQTVKANGSPLTNIVEAYATQNSSLYLDSSGNLWGAGNNVYGQLVGVGKGSTVKTAVPLTRPDSNPIVKIWVNASDGESVFAKTSDGTIYLAGNNTNGYGSIGTTSASANVWSKVIVPDGKTIANIKHGGDGGLFLMTDGSVYFAGANDTGGRGQGYTGGGQVTTMSQVPLPGPAIDIASTYYDSYAAVVAA